MKVQERAPLEKLTTFGVKASAERLAVLESRDELPELAALLKKHADQPKLLIGLGSNLLFTKDFNGTAVLVRLKGLEELPAGENGEYRFRAAAGESWDALVRKMTSEGHPGLENLVLIPSSVGATAVQNIGAYGVEAAELIESAEIFDLETETFRILSNEECDFSYRHSVFKKPGSENWLITSVTFALPAADAWHPKTDYKALEARLAGKEVTSQSVMETVEAMRREKLPDPAETGSAGSFFTNPIVTELQARSILSTDPGLVTYPIGGRRVKLAAGWLIDRAGFKGRSVGGAGVWERQALVLVNRGNASGSEVKQLSDEIIRGVDAKFGVKLTPEVIIL